MCKIVCELDLIVAEIGDKIIYIFNKEKVSSKAIPLLLNIVSNQMIQPELKKKKEREKKNTEKNKINTSNTIEMFLESVEREIQREK